MDDDIKDKRPSSGLFIILKPGEKFYIKDTNYVLKNRGQFTVDLQVYTKEYDLWSQEQERVRGMTKGVGPSSNISQGKKYWVKIKGEKGE